ncbi:hydroxyacid dehydrogenase [Neobacillus piezotolerans]|uniref:Hydroxyacid dehydrogenase n=1 Tax=Neobacillus piezotolerans TaxID=2259171 RepID=A0A3D8GPZ2_9BACI|nr:hydroxyacid dehydrogenase [Neobacillus piezotolerans]RDU36560.1 hydroxyacid dehydrogenase [Neobacillus piezotolerans]
MKKPKILQILSMYHPEGEKILLEGADVIRTDNIETETLCQLAAEVDGIVLRAPARITRDIIDAAPKLKAISGAGVGLDNIDVAHATSKGILVLHAPSVNAVSTAEHAVMLIMALGKSLIPFQAEMSQGKYASRTRIKTYELQGKTAGIVGFGSIAKETAKRLKLGLGLDVTAWVRKYDEKKHGIAKEWGVTITEELESLFSNSDFVSLHIPLTHQTRGLVDSQLLALMKPTAYLINTARGGVVDQAALYEALKDKRIAGAGLDVFAPEPPEPDDPILSLPNIIATPHIGGTTVECNYIMSTTVAKNILKAVKGEKPDYVGNPEVFKRNGDTK